MSNRGVTDAGSFVLVSIFGVEVQWFVDETWDACLCHPSESPELDEFSDIFVLDLSHLVQCYDEVMKPRISGLAAHFGGRSHKRDFYSRIRAALIDIWHLLTR